MLGFNPIAATPLADISIGQLVSITGEEASLTQNSLSAAAAATYTLTGFSLALTQNALATTADANYTLDGLSLVLTQNATAITATATYTLDSQTVTTTQNNFSVTADSVYLLLKQVDMVMSVNSVDLGVYINLEVTGQEITSTLNSVEAYPITYVNLTAQSPLVLTQHGTYEAIAFRAPSQTIHTTLHSMRMWKKIDPSQLANWTAITASQSAGWAPINTTQSPGWTDIET